jgi:hypothetical protein
MSEFLNSATGSRLSERRIEPVTRRYRPEAAASTSWWMSCTSS